LRGHFHCNTTSTIAESRRAQPRRDAAGPLRTGVFCAGLGSGSHVGQSGRRRGLGGRSTQTIIWTDTLLTGTVTVDLLKAGPGSEAWPGCRGFGAFDWTSSPGRAADRLFDSAPVVRGFGRRGHQRQLYHLGRIAPAGAHRDQPNGGENWPAGSTQTITWTAANPQGAVDVYLAHPPESSYWLVARPWARGMVLADPIQYRRQHHLPIEMLSTDDPFIVDASDATSPSADPRRRRRCGSRPPTV